jgi:hypothetical protein
MAIPSQADPVAGQRYLLLADISGYTAFWKGVEQAHGVDFSSGIPAGYEVVGAPCSTPWSGACSRPSISPS